MLSNEYIDNLANTIARYTAELLKQGMDPYITLQLTLGFQSTLLQKATETYAAPGWPTKGPQNGTKNDSRNSGDPERDTRD
jgi:hypothetical protein